MANSWKKITDKIDKAPVSGPYASDWEAMNAKIAAHPSVSNPKGRGGFWFKSGLGVVLLVILGLGYFWFATETSSEVNQNSSQAERNIAEPAAVFHESSESGEVKDYSTTYENMDEVNKVSDPKTEEQRNSVEILEELETVEKSKVVVEGTKTVGGNAGEDSSENKEKITTGTIVSVDEQVGMEVKNAEVPSEVENSIKEEVAVEELAFGEEDQMVASEGQFVNSEETHQPEDVEDAVVESDGNNVLLPVIAEENEEFVGELEPLEEIKEIAATESLSLMNSEESESSAPADPVNLRSAGFRLNGLNVGGGYSTYFSDNLYGMGLGVDVDIQRGGLLLNTGVHYYQMNTLSQFVKHTTNTNYSTVFNTIWDTTVTVVRDSAWVIDSAFAGHWADKSYTVTSITSTTYTINDSTITKIETKEERRVKLSYLELPVLAGHRFRFNHVAVDLYGGVILNQLTTGTVEGADIEKKFGVDAVLQPAIRYYIKPQWSMFARAGLRYGLVANEYRPQKLYSNFQLGLTYHW